MNISRKRCHNLHWKHCYLTQRDLDAVISQVLMSSLLGLAPDNSELIDEGSPSKGLVLGMPSASIPYSFEIYILYNYVHCKHN